MSDLKAQRVLILRNDGTYSNIESNPLIILNNEVHMLSHGNFLVRVNKNGAELVKLNKSALILNYDHDQFSF